MAETYNIDRKTASRLLNVSIRTIDRYLSSGRLSSIKNNGRVWLSREDLIRISKENDVDRLNDIRRHRHVDNLADINVDNTVIEPEVVADRRQDDKYKELYEEAKGDLEDRQRRLDQATYRIGQLEAQVQSMVPLVELRRHQELLAETTEKYSSALQQEEEKRKELASTLLKEINTKELALNEQGKELEIERLNKAIFAVILFVVLALQPLFWFMLR